MEIIIHRDTEKIGGSCVELISEQGSRIVLDIGMPLMEDDESRFDFAEYKELPVADLVEEGVLPDIENFYEFSEVKADSDREVAGVLLSHSHQDHYGLVDYVHKSVPIYLSEATKELIDITTNFTPQKVSVENYHLFTAGKCFPCGDFKITPYLMDHSSYDSYAFLIESDDKRIVYTGDFRGHGRTAGKLNYFLENIEPGLEGLIIEGTNLGKEKNIRTEKEIEQELTELARGRGPILVNCSGQNIDRLISLYRTAKKTDRIFLVDLYTANVLKRLNNHSDSIPHPSPDFPEIKVFYSYRLKNRLLKSEQEDLVYNFDSYRMKKSQLLEQKNNIIMLVRATMLKDLQMLGDMDADFYREAKFVYSMWDGYLQQEKYRDLKNFIEQENMGFYKIHTSGHARRSAIKRVVNKLKPQKVFPIHTMNPDEYRKLDGEIIKLKNGISFKL